MSPGWVRRLVGRVMARWRVVDLPQVDDRNGAATRAELEAARRRLAATEEHRRRIDSLGRDIERAMRGRHA